MALGTAAGIGVGSTGMVGGGWLEVSVAKAGFIIALSCQESPVSDFYSKHLLIIDN